MPSHDRNIGAAASPRTPTLFNEKTALLFAPRPPFGLRRPRGHQDRHQGFRYPRRQARAAARRGLQGTRIPASVRHRGGRLDHRHRGASSTARPTSAWPAAAPFPTEVSAASANGRTLKPTIVAYDGIAIIVNSANPVKTLTKKQIEQIFTGEVTDWSAVGGKPGAISIYTRNTSSGTYSDFKKMTMSGKDYAGSVAEDGRQRGNRLGSGQEPERHRLRRHGLPEGRRASSPVAVNGVLPSIATVQNHDLPRLALDLLLHQRRADRRGQGASSISRSAQRARRSCRQVGFAPLK